MKRTPAVLILASALAPLLPSVARADGFRSYRLCGGDSFITCAAVEITVAGPDVTVRVWNLSGNAGVTGQQTPAFSLLRGIGFYNVPAGVTAVAGWTGGSGPAAAGHTPGSWYVKNIGPNAFALDYAALDGSSQSAGISSGCGQISAWGGDPTLYQSPCNNLGGPGWVTFQFKVNGGGWDPGRSDIIVRATDDTGQYTEFWTGTCLQDGRCSTYATPEPITMTLLATGLAGMGGAGMMRRRRRR